jgi:signal transduction histidine kinase
MTTLELPRIFAPSLQANLLKARCQNAGLQDAPWLNGLCRAVHEPLLILNEDRRVIKANPALLDLFGLVQETQILGMALDIKDAHDFGRREEQVRINDEEFWIVALVDRRDESRRRALEKVFLHDILNTAGGVKGLSEVMVDAAPGDMDSLKDTVKNLADQLVDEITAQRDFLSAEHDDLVVDPVPIYAADVAQTVLQRYHRHPLAGNRQLVIRGEREPVVFRTDPTLLARILGNMIKNALEASPDGAEVILDFGCAAAQENAGPSRPGDVWFSVHNPGYIPREIQTRIFTRSFSTKGAGRGLGTYGMRLLCERFLAGRVGFHSHPTDGTVFKVTLPFDGPCR